ncbi:MAG: hypothetical protein QXQ20_08750 [Candidatus Nezhaarchaeales archaeon]
MEKTGKPQLELQELEGVVRKRKPRFRQIVWLDLEDFVKIADLASRLGVAENTLISLIVKRYLERNQDPLKVVEKKVPAGFYCPVCIKMFARPAELLEHLRLNEECRSKVVS